MSTIAALFDLAETGHDAWTGAASGPEGKRAFGGLIAAQSLAAACRTIEGAHQPTNLHLQFLRGGDAGAGLDLRVDRVYDGRTAASRRVEARQAGRLLTTATVSFSVPLAGPEHGVRQSMPTHPDDLPQSGPPGPAPSLPLGELDIRLEDVGEGDRFLRRMWWRVTAPLPDDPLLHTLIAVYITDLYGVEPASKVHGHSMSDRTHRTGTTDSSIWLHRSLRADEWNLLESESPAAARGRSVITASLLRTDGVIAATLVQEGLLADRDA